MSAARRNGRGPQLDRANSRVLRGALGRLVPAFATFAVFSVFVNLLRLTIPLYLLTVVDRVVSSQSRDTLLYITIIAVGALLVSSVLGVAMKAMQVRAGAWLEERVLPSLSRATIIGSLTDQSHGVRALRDLGQLRNFLSGQVPGTLLEFPWTPVFLLVIVVLHPWLGVFAVCATLLLLALALLNDASTAGAQRDAQMLQARSRGQVNAVMGDAGSLAAMGMTGRFVTRLRQMTVEFLGRQGTMEERTGLFSSAQRFLRSVAQVGILGLGALLILEGEITTGTMIAASILQGLALSPVDKAVGAVRQGKAAREAYANVARQLEAVNTREDHLHLESGQGLAIRAHQAMYMPRGRAQPVLRPLTFELEAGRMMGILGAGGAGKSTLCRLILGIVRPGNGSMLVNDLEVAHLRGEEFGDLVGYVPQLPYLLPGTVADNISRLADPADPQRSARVAEAARLAGIHDTILSTPQRYETKLDDEGQKRLTPSQVQQLMLARAFYGSPRLLVLDEPTTFLDKAGEGAVMAALETLREGGTTIVAVSQRPALLNACDRLLWLRDGVMADFGEPDAVLKSIARGVGRGAPRLVSNADQGGRKAG